MREQHPRFDHIGRRDFLAVGAAGLALAGAPGLAAGQAKRSGEIVAGLSERMLTLDPANHYSISTTSVLRHLFDPLIDVTNDSKFIPALAESWRPINNTTWRFTLRKGVAFHDGTPFNADSVVFTLRRVQSNSKLIKSFVYQDIESVEKDGDYAVIVTSKRPFGSLPAHLTMLGMLPPSVGKNEEAFFQKPIGTGPFRFASLDPRRSHRDDRESELLEAGHPQGREGHLPLHSGAIHAHGRPPGRRAARDRPGHAGSR